MFSWGVDGNDDFDITLCYRGTDGVSFSLTPRDACAFYGTDPKVCNATLSGVGTDGGMKIEIGEKFDLVQIYRYDDEKRGTVGGLGITLHGKDKVDSLLATLETIRTHLAAHATEDIVRELSAEIAARATIGRSADVSERPATAPHVQPLCTCDVCATSNDALREGARVGIACCHRAAGPPPHDRFCWRCGMPLWQK